jgi:hypothetical protein
MTHSEKIKEIERLIRLIKKGTISSADFDGAIINLYKDSKTIKESLDKRSLSFANWLQLNCFLDRENDDWLLAEGKQEVYEASELYEIFKTEKKL